MKCTQQNVFTDIDECENNPCDVNALCVNTPGTHICDCNIGYSGTGYNCTGLYYYAYTHNMREIAKLYVVKRTWCYSIHMLRLCTQCILF